MRALRLLIILKDFHSLLSPEERLCVLLLLHNSFYILLLAGEWTRESQDKVRCPNTR